MKKIIILALGVFAWNSLFSSETIRLPKNLQSMAVGKNIEVYKDADNKYSIQDVVSATFPGKWEKSNADVPNYGFSDATYWVKFRIDDREAGEDYFLEYGYPPIDQIDFYGLDANNQILFHKKGGDSVDYSKRDIIYRNILFDMQNSDNRITQYVMKIKSTSSINIDLVLWKYKYLLEKIDTEQGFLHLYFGIMVALILYTFFLFISVKDINYLNYIIFLVASFFLDYTLLGNAYRIFDGKTLFTVNNNIPLFLNLTNITALVFSRRFLNSRNIFHKTDKFLIGIGMVIVILMVYSIFGSYHKAISLSMPISFLEYIILGIVGVIAFSRGYKAAKFYMIAFGILIAFSMVIVLKTVGIFPINFFTTYAMYIGRAANMILLSLALADRINILKQEKETALREKLAESEKVARMSRAFQRFVPLKFLDLLGKEDVTQIVLGDNISKEMTISFSDIRSFTTMSEKMSPEENFQFINEFLKKMQPVIHSNNGFIDKYLGDAIMALFDRNAEDALNAALMQHSALAIYNQERENMGKEPIRIGIGINTGPLMLGTIGADERMDGTVISDAVNLASRLEGMNKKYMTSILISNNTYDRIQEKEKYQIRKIDYARVRGKEIPITIYEVLDVMSSRTDVLKQEASKIFAEALTLFGKRQMQEAMDIFREIFSKNPEDKVAELYIERCMHYIKNLVHTSDEYFLTE